MIQEKGPRGPFSNALKCQPMIVKRCACGAAYTERGWDQLAVVGVISVPEDADGPAEKLEMRNCACGSTIARKLMEGEEANGCD